MKRPSTGVSTTPLAFVLTEGPSNGTVTRNGSQVSCTPNQGFGSDAGTLIPGLHCAMANDDLITPHPPEDTSCRQWMGDAPDIGPFELGL